jgi:hypothetical protein
MACGAAFRVGVRKRSRRMTSGKVSQLRCWNEQNAYAQTYVTAQQCRNADGEAKQILQRKATKFIDRKANSTNQKKCAKFLSSAMDS